MATRVIDIPHPTHEDSIVMAPSSAPPPPNNSTPPPNNSKGPEKYWKGYPFIYFSWEMPQAPADTTAASESLERYLNAESITELYSHALERMEKLYGEAMVQDVFSVLWRSQEGLPPQDIAAICQRQLESVEQLIEAMGNHLIWHCESVLLSEALRTAVARRYHLTGPVQNAK